jgi:hypothetical protein
MVESSSHLSDGAISIKGFMEKASILVTDVHQYEE